MSNLKKPRLTANVEVQAGLADDDERWKQEGAFLTGTLSIDVM